MYMFRSRNIDYHGQASKLICWKYYHVRNKISKEQCNNDSNSKTSKLTMWNSYKFNMNKLHVSRFHPHRQKLTCVNHFCAPLTFIFVLNNINGCDD